MKQYGQIRIVKARDFDHAKNLCAWAYGIAYIGRNRYKCFASKADYLNYTDRLKRENPDAFQYL